jgi:hypothetical protein
MRSILSVVVLSCAASTSLAGLAFSNATVQPSGPRTGANGLNFFNLEGSANNTFASFGVVRFNLTADKANFDTLYGPGNWTITGATLSLTESNAAFSHAGGVSVYYSPDDTTDITNGSPVTSPLRYNAAFLPGGNSQGSDGLLREAAPLASYIFPTTGNINTGQVDSYALALSPGLLANLSAGGDAIVTLVLEDQDPTVAATYAGFSNATLAGPTLTITAVPAPGAIALLGLGTVVAARRRRA